MIEQTDGVSEPLPDSIQLVDEQHNFIGKLKRKCKEIFKRPEIQLANTAGWLSRLGSNSDRNRFGQGFG